MPKLSLLVRVSFCFLFLFLPLENMDEWFYDRYFSIRGPQLSETSLVLVRVDDAKVPASTPKVNWPLPLEPRPDPVQYYPVWHEDFYSALITELKKQDPALIAFTSFFGASTADESKPRSPDPKVIYGALINEEQQIVPPPSWLTTGENYGFVNLFPEQDNRLRRTRLIHESTPSLSLRGYHRMIETPPKRDLSEPFWIDFRGPANSFPSFLAENVVKGNIPHDAFKNKVVLIGPTAGPVNRFETPFGSLSRLEIHASIMDTFLQDRELRHLPGWVTVLIGALAVLASATIILSFPLSSAWICLLLLALFLLIVSLFLFAYFKIWIGVANPLVCIFGTHLLMMGYKLGRQEEKQQRIQQKAAHLKEMDQFKNNFISLFSHDLKTPIAKIKAIVGRLLSEQTGLSPEVESSLKTVARTNDELARFISDILKVTRMETMSMEPAKEVIDLNRLVEEAVKRNRFQADEKNITLTVDLEPLFSMEGDQKLIEEIITNLLENAIKYSPANSNVVISTREEGARVWVAVEDQGEGIPEEEIPRVTGKFYRGKSAEKSTKGSGLGLYLAKYFVELHDGTIEIHSKLGEGTRVRFSLPLPE